MEGIRKPGQGVWNIIRFNWHFYVLSLVVILLLLIGALHPALSFSPYLYALALLIFIITLISLGASFYIYDLSDLYTLNWLDDTGIEADGKIINIHAGFDETSVLLHAKYPAADLHVFDFYDPAMHTEVSIKRARKAYSPYPGTQQISTSHIPVANESADTIFLILAAHEIRDVAEMNRFFAELKRSLKTSGRIIVTEHLCDIANFSVYTIGFLHFMTRSSWLQTFRETGFAVSCEMKITPFITTFILTHHDPTS